LRGTGSAGVPGIILDGWHGFTPSVRGEAVAALTSRTPWALALLNAVAAKTVPAAQIDSSRRAVLFRHRDATVRARAVELFGDAAKTPRSEIVAKYQRALDSKSDSKRGHAVFQRECATCHLAGTAGHNVGPSIAAIGVKRPEDYLVAILDPNREVDPRYLNYTVNLTDGRVSSGIIAAETATALTLKRADGQTETILRSQVEELSSTGQSLMPEGVEQKVSHQEMADLIAFLLATVQGLSP
jgi:putative heme-binding domain-containing protein